MGILGMSMGKRMADFLSAAMCCLLWMPVEAASANPFLSEPDTPFGVPAFDRIEPEHFIPALTEGMRRQNEEIETIVSNPEKPTFANTIAELDRSGALLRHVTLVLRGLSGANTNPEIQKINSEISSRLAAHRDDIRFNSGLFARIKTVYDQRGQADLSDDQTFLLEHMYRDYVRNGAALGPKDQEKLRNINAQLSVLQVKFRQNLLAETNRFQLVVTDKRRLRGLPATSIAHAADEARKAGMDGKWVFTTHKPSMIPFLTYCQDRNLRKQLFLAYVNRANNQNEHDNKAIIKDIVKLRLKRANLLGYETYADFALERRMAENPKNVTEFLDMLWQAALPVAKRERDAMQAIIDNEGGGFDLAAWDWWYYAEKLRKQQYSLDDAELRPYFELSHVCDGVFSVANQLYGLTFTPLKGIPRPHRDAQAFQVNDPDGSHRAILYMDFHPRPSKRQGAWCGAYRHQSKSDGETIHPIVTVVCNLTQASGKTPPLLSLDEVETVFHEFGHALDVMLSDVTFHTRFHSADFSELPSQIMEHWAIEPLVLKKYAKHYQSGKVIPDELIDKIVKSKKFNQGFKTVEYLAASLLDMKLHTLTQIDIDDMNAFEAQYFKKIGLIPEIVSRYRVTYFAHIVGSYAAGYYSYIWAGILDNDAFEAFKETDLFDQSVAQRFRKCVLEKNGAADFMGMYKAFRGREPDIKPLLRNRGLIQ